MGDFLANAEKAIPAEVHMISGCMDSQTSADVSNVASFSLPDPAGKAGGALTSSLLNVLYSDHRAPAQDLSFQDVLVKVRGTLTGKYTQIPQLSSSRPMDVSSPFEIVPKGCTGTRRALLIGINYIGQRKSKCASVRSVRSVRACLRAGLCIVVLKRFAYLFWNTLLVISSFATTHLT